MDNWLVIDKCDDEFYFKDIDSIAKYLNLTKPQIYAIVVSCRKNYIFRNKKYGVFIQCLYNNTATHLPNNPQFIWDWSQRKEYNRIKWS